MGARPPGFVSVPPTPASVPAELAKKGAKLDMDWDDDQEATQVFDKEGSKAEPGISRPDPEASAQSLVPPTPAEPERASMDAIMSAGPVPTAQAPTVTAPPIGAMVTAPMAAMPSPATATSATLSGAFAALGAGPASQRLSAPPATQPVRSALPPPPGHPSATPPPPPPGQVTTAPMHMPLQPAAVPHTDTMQSMQSPLAAPQHAHTSAPPPVMVPSTPPPSMNLPPVGRAMDQTHMVPRVKPSRTPMFAAIGGVFVAAALGFFFLMPRSGTLVVNVADSKGGVVPNLEVSVDGTKRCEAAPCILRDVPAGVHEVKVAAKGFDPSAPRAVTVDSRHDQSADFQLTSSKTTTGTGFKVAATHGGVKLNVDGKDIGLLPQELRDVQPGEHNLRFSGERYATLEKTISVAKDEIVDLGNVNLKVSKGKATLQLGTPGAKVYIVNGSERKEVPQLPVAIEFGPNEKWELHGTKDGFDDYREQITFDDGQADKTFTVTLAPKSAPGAAPHAPVAAYTPPAPVAKEPAAPVAKAAPPAPVKAAPAAADPAPAPAPAPAAKKDAPAAATGEGVLKINSLPASAIVLDGKPIGTTPQLHVAVSPGTHTIMFVNSEQSLKKTISVEVKAGETKAAFAKLRD